MWAWFGLCYLNRRLIVMCWCVCCRAIDRSVNATYRIIAKVTAANSDKGEYGIFSIRVVGPDAQRRPQFSRPYYQLVHFSSFLSFVLQLCISWSIFFVFTDRPKWYSRRLKIMTFSGFFFFFRPLRKCAVLGPSGRLKWCSHRLRMMTLLVLFDCPQNDARFRRIISHLHVWTDE